MKLKRKKNPQGDVINGIHFVIAPLIQEHVYAEQGYGGKRVSPVINDIYHLIREFSEILNKKFPAIKNRVPLIVFQEFDQFQRIQSIVGLYKSSNIIQLKSDYDPYLFKLRYLFHELGHFVFRKYLSQDAINYFNKYVESTTVKLNLNKIMQIWSTHVLAQKNLPQKLEKLEIEIDDLNRFTELYYEFASDQELKKLEIEKRKLDKKYEELLSFKQEFSIKYPILTTILSRTFIFNTNDHIFRSAKEYSKYLRKHIEDLKKYVREEDLEKTEFERVKNALYRRRSPTFYDINPEEVFCEIFANYMLYGNRALMYNENYQVLKTIFPELR